MKSLVLKILPYVAWTTFFLAPLWSQFLEAWLKQNGLLDDPNQTVQSLIATGFSIAGSNWFTAIVLFVAGCFAGHVGPRHIRRLSAFVRGRGHLDHHERTLKAISALKSLISECPIDPKMEDHSNSAKQFFATNGSKLRSFNLTLSKLGFDQISFEMRSEAELRFLFHIQEEISPFLEDEHYEEAYAELSSLLKNSDQTLYRWDRERPVVWWVEEDGSLFCPNHNYHIPAHRLHECYETNGHEIYSWPSHMVQKTWVELGVFLDAYKSALENSESGIDLVKYKRSVADARSYL